MRVAEGLMSVEELLSFIGGNNTDPLAGMAIGAVVIAAFLGGLAMNLTPCVLPMVPINLIVIGRSFRNALAYSIGIALAYGGLGLSAAIGGLAFGTIQANPWFNLAVALIFLMLAFSLAGVFHVDLSHFRKRANGEKKTMGLAFSIGVMSAILAGACVAPILIAVLVLTARLFAEGQMMALALPLVLGLGMASPWPFLGMGMRLLPKPGAWMKWINLMFALVVVGLAVWYGVLAWRGFFSQGSVGGVVKNGMIETTTDKYAEVLAEAKRPVLVDCWASWCKNCAAMEKVIQEEKVQSALKGWTVIRLQAESMRKLRELPGFETVRGLPAIGIIKDL